MFEIERRTIVNLNIYGADSVKIDRDKRTNNKAKTKRKKNKCNSKIERKQGKQKIQTKINSKTTNLKLKQAKRAKKIDKFV